VVTPIQATAEPAQVGIVDVVLVAVKAWQVPEVAQSIEPLVGADTSVIPLQNGLEAATQLSTVLGAEHVIGGSCRIYSLITAPGCIRHIGLEPTIIIGELDAQPRARTDRIRLMLERAGITAINSPHIQAELWEKFLLLRWGVVGAVTRVPAGVMRSLPSVRQMVEQACQEVIMVARACDVELPGDITVQSMAILDSLPPIATTSMQRDILEGRPSELDAQVAALGRMGQQVGVSTPLHDFLHHGLLPQELVARGEVQLPS
jgi:2-dehydropantoate 2-reductase